MTVAEFNDKVIEIVRDSFDFSEGTEITSESKLLEDLGMSSLAILAMISDLEDAFDVRIPTRKLSKIVTVGDLQQFILNKLV
ncbi:MAG: phosphopantetheine-binding protein [Lachnospiraceae bacterium]|nr:phosphopantetheine-binding protein [Clostridiales bacterium]MCD8363045.1 phosphopantetheine-binding protein [Lachnospiraceae bacterium]